MISEKATKLKKYPAFTIPLLCAFPLTFLLVLLFYCSRLPVLFSRENYPATRLPVPVPYGISGRDCPVYSGYRVKSSHLQVVKEWDENGHSTLAASGGQARSG
ncbi:MAG: hypothetical protein COT17_00215 [Elusimicrobia bacterium CG08_land_8_20_14_0_20_51_18]|nr:MAG: hypothetical protein COT17_00215 [Elusimicrobia bacterium CG08_land_8_20_14_0_20_51_18]